jgi:hypothetical protein
MTVERHRNWVSPTGRGPDEIADWIQRHYQDHVDESTSRIEDFTNHTSVTALDDLANTSLSDPDADRILFWDDSDTQYEFLVANTGLAISANNLNLSHLGIESLSDAGADKILFWDDGETATGWLAPSTGISISGTNLTTDDSAIDHNSLSNTHNLTTDVDHGAIGGLDDDDHSAIYYNKTTIDGIAESVASFEIANDAATSWTPTNAIGVLIIHCSYQADIDENAIISYRTTATAATSIIAANGASTIEVTTGALTGTDGSDNAWTVSAHTDGKIYFENRLGATKYFRGVQVL